MDQTRPCPCRAVVGLRAMWPAVSGTPYRHSARRQRPKFKPQPTFGAHKGSATLSGAVQKDRPFSSEVRHEAVGVSRRRLRSSSSPAGPSSRNGVPPCRQPPGGVCPTGVPDWTATEHTYACQRPPTRVVRISSFLVVARSSAASSAALPFPHDSVRRYVNRTA